MMSIARQDRPEIVVMVGMPRSGSTTLYHQLRQHPAAALPFRKETFYFSFHHGRGVDWFLDLYRDAEPGQVGFDISPDYFFSEQAIDRILDFDARTKAILSVRDPVSWALSLYNQRAGTDLKLPPFEEFVHRYDLRVGDKTISLELSRGLVTRMLKRCREAFGERLLVYDFGLFSREPLRVVQAIEAFVGLPRHFTTANFSNVRLNASNRRNNPRLYALLNNERLISWLQHLFPERLLTLIREKYYLAAARNGPSDPRAHHPEANVLLAEEIFAEERVRVRELFANSPMQLGSGTPFDP